MWALTLRICTLPGDCTSIVAKSVSDKSIVIAADSRMVNVVTGQQSQVCKIHVVPNFVWAVSGVAKNFETGWDINATITKIVGTKLSLGSRVKGLDVMMPLMIEPEGQKIRETRPMLLQPYLDGRVFLEVLFIGFEETN
jgi:hypothetical protein